MTASTLDVSSLLSDSEPLSDELFEELLREVRKGAYQKEKFAEELQVAMDNRPSDLAQDSGIVLKVAQSYYVLSQYDRALEWVDKASSVKQACWLKARILKALGQYERAIKEFEKAENKGFDSFQISMAVVDCLRRSGDLEATAEKLKRVSRIGEIRAEYHYQLGRLHEVNGLHQEAIDEYEQAVSLDGNHSEALFHLAYVCDLYGDEELAIKYYQQCVNRDTPSVNALLNLAVLYEDAEKYEQAVKCIKKVLSAYPNHHRARLFYKDVSASMTMYYDEDHERKVDRRNQVLKIPISDFELSVRSRNCLRKMNIKNLNDLLRVTESELLAYKNFGETSLQEIKSILNQKGLRLGQMLEDRNNDRPLANNSEQDVETENTVDETPEMSVEELELSVRARKCLTRLNINTIGELINRTEEELLGCKNFGLTSLEEIKQRLKERNMTLRHLEE